MYLPRLPPSFSAARSRHSIGRHPGSSSTWATPIRSSTTTAPPPSVAELSSPAETVSALDVGVLASEAVSADDILEAGVATVLGTVDLSRAPSTAGVYSFALDPAAAAAASQAPLALLARRPDQTHRVICRETTDGLYVRADEFVQRIDARTSAALRLYAVRRGAPAPGVTIHLTRPGAAGSALARPEQVVTGADGTAEITLTAGAPGNPRGAIDGVVERIGYAPRRGPGGSPDYAGTGLDRRNDVIVAHVRDVYNAPAVPDWRRDIQPILAQYARLYPIMREHLVDLADLDAVRRLRTPLLFAMTRDIADPNYMPVTRDLSAAKRAAIVRWLEHLPAMDGGPPPAPASADAGVGEAPGVAAPTEVADVAATTDDDPLRFDAKSAAAAEIGRRVLERHAARTDDDDES